MLNLGEPSKVDSSGAPDGHCVCLESDHEKDLKVSSHPRS